MKGIDSPYYRGILALYREYDFVYEKDGHWYIEHKKTGKRAINKKFTETPINYLVNGGKLPDHMYRASVL
jgi:hypothetical protein